MKKFRLLCTLALVVAMVSAFTSKKQVPIYRINDGGGAYHFEDQLPEGECVEVIKLPCSFLVDNITDMPATPNTEPTTGNPVASPDEGAYN